MLQGKQSTLYLFTILAIAALGVTLLDREFTLTRIALDENTLTDPPHRIAGNKAQFETDGWQTYRNEEYGFEVKYPAGFSVGDLMSPARAYEQPGLLSLVSLEDERGIPGAFTISVFDNTRKLAIPTWIDSSRPGYYRNDVTVFDTNVCGTLGKYYSSVQGAKRGIYFVKDMRLYALEWHEYTKEDAQGIARLEDIRDSFSCP